MKLEFKISGVIRELGSGRPLAELLVRAYDKDLIYDDLLGNAVTDNAGRFEMKYTGKDFKELFDNSPDIYLKIMDKDGSRVIYSNADSVRWDAGKDEFFEIEIPMHKLPPRENSVELVDANGKHKLILKLVNP